MSQDPDNRLSWTLVTALPTKMVPSCVKMGSYFAAMPCLCRADPLHQRQLFRNVPWVFNHGSVYDEVRSRLPNFNLHSLVRSLN
jgi:hypothetical protein